MATTWDRRIPGSTSATLRCRIPSSVRYLEPLQQAYRSHVQELPKFVNRQACLTQH